MDRVSKSLLERLARLGVRRAFGVTGGAVAPFCDALGASDIEMIHCRHESGAAFAAAEAYFASGTPSLVFCTTGPGITNALTGLTAARWEGAKVVLVSASTSAPVRGRGACQETSGYTMPLAGLFNAGPLFHYAVMMEHPSELEEVLARLASGLARPGGFIAHVSLPTSVQGTPVEAPRGRLVGSPAPTCSTAAATDWARTLAGSRFAIWVGFGARGAAAEVRALVERSGAPVMCSPRAKGIFPERHPSFLGVTGAGGHGNAEAYMRAHRPDHVLVLGSRLGETTSYWQDDYVPTQGFIHVDIDPTVPGTAFPHATTYAVHAEIKGFLTALLAAWPGSPSPASSDAPDHAAFSAPPPSRLPGPSSVDAPVRPAVLMDAIQRLVIDASDAMVMTEAGNAFIWGNHLLRFDTPGRYRVSLDFGSMGHFAAGVVGAALARNGKVVGITGDGSMLMNCEVNTAVQYGAKAVWVVFNDAGYGIVDQGMRALGFRPKGTALPRVDFAAVARAMGAEGLRVDAEAELGPALARAMATEGPVVVDVRIDAREPGPWMDRIRALIAQGACGTGSPS
jgi:acetolactate synthase I/II/III large subunit